MWYIYLLTNICMKIRIQTWHCWKWYVLMTWNRDACVISASQESNLINWLVLPLTLSVTLIHNVLNWLSLPLSVTLIHNVLNLLLLPLSVTLIHNILNLLLLPLSIIIWFKMYSTNYQQWTIPTLYKFVFFADLSFT